VKQRFVGCLHPARQQLWMDGELVRKMQFVSSKISTRYSDIAPFIFSALQIQFDPTRGDSRKNCTILFGRWDLLTSRRIAHPKSSTNAFLALARYALGAFASRPHGRLPEPAFAV